MPYVTGYRCQLLRVLGATSSQLPLLRRISITDKLDAARQPGQITVCLQFNELLPVQLLSTALARCLYITASHFDFFFHSLYEQIFQLNLPCELKLCI